MVKRGGTKKKIPMEKITKKLSIAPTFTKRRDGLFSKASQLCLLSGAHIAILATPPSSESNVSFYSFGHSSVDDVVSAFLYGQRLVPVLQGNNKETREDVGVCFTRKDLGLGLWWEDESLNRSENPEELRDAMDSMWTLLSDLKELKTNNVNNDGRDHTHQAFVNDDDEDLKKKETSHAVGFHDNGAKEPDHQTLILHSTTSPAICCIPDDDIIVIDDDDDSLANFNKITDEQYQINEICESFVITDNNNNNNNDNAALHEVNLDYNNQEMDIEQNTTSSAALCCIPHDLLVNFNDITEEEPLIREFCATDNNNSITNIPEGCLDYAQEIDIEQLIDFDTPFEIFDDCVFENTTHHQDLEQAAASLLSNSEAVDDDDHVSMETTTDATLWSYLEGLEDEDDLHFSDYFNNLPL